MVLPTRVLAPVFSLYLVLISHHARHKPTVVSHSMISFSELVASFESSKDHATQPTAKECSSKINSAEHLRDVESTLDWDEFAN